ncbi:MAG: hypothetical protein CM15mP120_26490 [Pseudomonadota bacterium]|nr:MAG: hypothetical protein CM15mP120_26490 [Pseudomonadota bacterium]
MAMWADRRNRRNLIAFSISLWSAMTVFCGMAVQVLALLLPELASASAKPVQSPSHSIISDLYKPEERATAMAIFGLGVNFGIMLGYLIGGWVNEWIGWRWAFVVAGVPGLIIAVIVRWTMVEPPRGYSDGLVESPRHPVLVRCAAYAQQLSNQTTRHRQQFNFYGGLRAIAWAPVYFQRVHGFSTAESGTFLALAIGVGGGLGTFLAASLLTAGRRFLRVGAPGSCAQRQRFIYLLRCFVTLPQIRSGPSSGLSDQQPLAASTSALTLRSCNLWHR